jgi:hypothetical protein
MTIITITSFKGVYKKSRVCYGIVDLILLHSVRICRNAPSANWCVRPNSDLDVNPADGLWV